MEEKKWYNCIHLQQFLHKHIILDNHTVTHIMEFG